MNTFVMLLLFILQEQVPLRRLRRIRLNKGESLGDLAQNRMAWRYLAVLSLAWLVHGYVYYSGGHDIYEGSAATDGDDPANDLAFVCTTDALAHFLVLGLVLWTEKTRPVAFVLMALASVCLALVAAFGNPDDTSPENEFMVETANHVCSFLISGSYTILWLLTAESFGHRSRY